MHRRTRWAGAVAVTWTLCAATAAQAGEVTVGEVSSQLESPSAEALRAALSERGEALDGCADSWRKQHEGPLAGTLLLKLTLDSSGLVEAAATGENTTGSAGLAGCYEQLFKGWKLCGDGSGGDVAVRLHVPPSAPVETAGAAAPELSPGERFAEWTARKENKAAVALLRALAQSEVKRSSLAQSHGEERTRNDEAETPDDVVRVPLFPEATGAFMFVKILDQSAGESLFAADDGPFVLRLSPGDSFRAFPGNRIQMTMHTRGERMRMTTGKQLPVFLSGASPAVPRTIKGVHPNRAKEKALLQQLGQERKAVLARLRAAVGKAAADGSFPLKSTRLVRVEWDADADARALVEDAEGTTLFCLELGLSCEDTAGETLDGSALNGP